MSKQDRAKDSGLFRRGVRPCSSGILFSRGAPTKQYLPRTRGIAWASNTEAKHDRATPNARATLLCSPEVRFSRGAPTKKNVRRPFSPQEPSTPGSKQDRATSLDMASAAGPDRFNPKWAQRPKMRFWGGAPTDGCDRRDHLPYRKGKSRGKRRKKI